MPTTKTSRPGTLTRADIVRAARALLAEAPGERLSMRKLAGRLGISAPSLYWHFRNYADLLDEVAAEVLGEIEWPEATGVWRVDVAAHARAVRETVLTEGEVAAAMLDWGVPEVVKRKAGFQSRAILEAAGFGSEAAAFGSRQLMWHVFGTVQIERAIALNGAPQILAERPRRYLALRIRGDAPPAPEGTVAEDDSALGDTELVDLDALFEHTLSFILDGLERDLAAARGDD